MKKKLLLKQVEVGSRYLQSDNTFTAVHSQCHVYIGVVTSRSNFSNAIRSAKVNQVCSQSILKRFTEPVHPELACKLVITACISTSVTTYLEQNNKVHVESRYLQEQVTSLQVESRLKKIYFLESRPRYQKIYLSRVT